MSKYVAPRFRKNESAEEKEDKLVIMVKESSVKDFPVLGGGSQAKPVSNLSYATKAIEWERKRLDAEAKLREEEYLAARQAEEDEVISRFIDAPKPKAVAPAPEEVEAIPVPVSEWTTVYRKPRREKKEKVFDDNDDDFNDNLDIEDSPLDVMPVRSRQN
jgi:hypothetical protein